MTDLISRQAAINEVQRFLGYIDQDVIDRIKIAIGRLPSAQPMRKRGKWIDGSILTYAVCSECGYQERYAYENNFCPNCGAEMGEDDHEVS